MAKIKKDTNLFILSGEEDEFDPTQFEGDLPEYVQEHNEAPYICMVRFKTEEDLHKFADVIGYPTLKIRTKRTTKSIWYPELGVGERGSNIMMRWIDGEEDEQT